MTRRTFLAPSLLPGAGGLLGSFQPQQGRVALGNANHKLEFDPATARLVSLRALPSDQEFIQGNDADPAFVIQYLDKQRFRQVSSTQATNASVETKPGLLTARFQRLGGMDLDAAITVRVEEPISRWSISVRNGAGIAITDVQFPFLVARYRLGGAPGSEAVLRPFISGQLLRSPKPEDLEPDSPHAWQFRPENHDTWHYPGLIFAQFLAYYNDRAGLYVACEDASGAIKLIKAVHHGDGLRLGFAHVGDWPPSGSRDLGYDVVVRSFTGDWYAAAELYREWSLKQPWARAPLHLRKDVPDWLLDSPPHIVVRIQGEIDGGPTAPNREFLPYRKIVPLVEKVADRIGSRVVPVIMSWERPGPWIYPDCFPPAGGEESLREFTRLARDRGWHIGTFCNGTRWVTHHFWSGYNGEDYYAERGGAKSVCRTHEQQPWPESWDGSWRPSYACCLGVPMTKEIAVDFVRRVLGCGLDWVQFLDQNVGCATFPCYAADHGHPPAPGKWMTAGMRELLGAFRELARGPEAEGRRVAFSVESPPNEYFMPEFAICDIRVIPPGHTNYERWFLPLFHFLYHEFILIQGGFGMAPEPYHMPIRNAYNLVIGEIPGGVLTPDGLLLNRDTNNWAPWRPPVGDNEDSLEMLRVTTALRRGKGMLFLVYGRMERPADVAGVRTVTWIDGGRQHRIPAVFHAAWRTPDRRFGIVLANWTKEEQAVSVADSRLGGECIETIVSKTIVSRTRRVERGKLSLPPLSSALLEAE
jgi:hypothetical protein